MAEPINREVGSDLRSAAKSAMQEARTNIKEQLSESYDVVKHKTQDAISASEGFVREHPLTTVLGACAVGFVAGLIARRNRH